MEINPLKSESSQKKPSFILLIIPIINSGLISPIIKYYDKGNYSDWSVTLGRDISVMLRYLYQEND